MRLVLFDCDGTLVDSQYLIAETMARTFAQHDLPPPAAEATRRVIGLSLEPAIAVLLGEPDGERSRRMAETYRREFFARRSRGDFDEPLFPGTLAMLRRLGRRGDLILGIVTGKSRRGVDLVCARHGIADLFRVVRTADDCPSKPHPAMVLECCSEAGVAPAAAIVVGDTCYDMEMAVAAGAAPLGVAWGYHAAADLSRAGARRVIGHFDALDGALEDALPDRTSAADAC